MPETAGNRRLQLHPVDAAVVLCLADEAALAALRPPRDVVAARVAPDETMLIGPLRRGQELLALATAALPSDDALVLDHTDAWQAWLLTGTTCRDAYARLTHVPAPPPGGLAQGAVCGLAAKILAVDAGLCVLVGSHLGHHLPDRILQACAELRIELGPLLEFHAHGAAS